MKTSLTSRLFYKPYNLFLLTSLLLFVSAFFLWGQTIDIHLYDTYYVIATRHFVWTLAIIFFAGWILYKVTNELLLTKYLTWTHIILTLTVLLLLGIAIFWRDKTPITQQTISFQTFSDELQRQRNIAWLITILFIVGQIAYIINLISGLIKRQV